MLYALFIFICIIFIEKKHTGKPARLGLYPMVVGGIGFYAALNSFQSYPMDPAADWTEVSIFLQCFVSTGTISSFKGI